MGLRRRLVLPFIAVFAGAYAVTAGVSIYLATRRVERQLSEPARNLGRLMDQFRWTSREMLDRTKAAFGADIAILDRNGDIATTIPALPDGSSVKIFEGLRPGVHVRPLGKPFVVACESLESGSELLIIYPAEHLSTEQWRAAMPLILLAIAGLGVVALVGYLIAQTIASPIERLAGQATDIAAGRRADVLPVGGGPELDQLAGAFNRMLES